MAERPSQSPQKAAPVLMSPHASGADAFKRIITAGLAHLRANEPAALAGADPEGVHQARVAIRRLRSALDLFRDHCDPAGGRAIDAGLRTLGQALGAARDWDVFLEKTIPRLAADGVGTPPTVIDLAVRSSREAHRVARRRLGSDAHAAFLAEIESWIAQDRWRIGLAADACGALDGGCRDFARPLLDRMARRARMRGRGLQGQTDEDRHDLRRTMKKLRYSAEFFASVYEPRKVGRYLKAVERVQDVLGDLNDAAAAASIADRMRAAGAPVSATDAIHAWVALRGAGEPSRLMGSWRAFKAARPFWE